ncbi:MAG: class I SAM-dependent methyltransferase [Chloroflexota bacterium]
MNQSDLTQHRAEMENFYAKHSGVGFWTDKYPDYWRIIAELRRKRDAAIASAISRPVGRILDVGCGMGDVPAVLKGRGNQIVGIDPVFVHTAESARNLNGVANVQFAQGTSEYLSFPANAFDVAILADVIEHVANPPRCLAEIRRVLVPGGCVIIVTPNRVVEKFWSRVDSLALTGLRALRLIAPVSLHVEPQIRDEHYSPAELRRLLREAGFEIERHDLFDFYPGSEGEGIVKGLLRRLAHFSRFRRRVLEPALLTLFGIIEPLRVFNNRQLLVARASKGG